MAVTLVSNTGVIVKSLEDFRNWAAQNRDSTFRKGNRQIDATEVQDGDTINVVVKASGNVR